MKEVSFLLRADGMPENLIESLAGNRYSQLKCTRLFNLSNDKFLDNYIDGSALAALPDDLDEFKLLVPQSGMRIKLKSIISKYFLNYSQVHTVYGAHTHIISFL